MKKITLTLLALVCALCFAFGFVACDDGPETVAVENVALSSAEITLTVGETETLTATVTPITQLTKRLPGRLPRLTSQA